jgi:hypothetical protein
MVVVVQELSRLPVTERAVRDTVERIFSAAAYNQTTLMSRFMAWLGDIFRRFLGLLRDLGYRIGESPTLSWLVIAIAAALVLLIAFRLVYLWQLRALRQATSPIRFGDAWFGGGGDPLAAAERAARAGNFTEAAHALYAAILSAIARQHAIRVHPSKTVGDYGRELRAAGSSLVSRYREFARTYETVIYGLGSCDRDRFERLYSIATPLLRPNG